MAPSDVEPCDRCGGDGVADDVDPVEDPCTWCEGTGAEPAWD